MDLIIYCMDVHITGGSVVDLNVEPLRRFFNVRLQAWDGVKLDPLPNGDAGKPCLWFFEYPPPRDVLSRTHEKIIWTPMWDYSKNENQSWWNHLPRTLKIVSFSKHVSERAEKAGLPTLSLRYFKDTRALPPALWDKKRVAMYWNRTGIFSPRFLEKFCEALKIDTLLFREDIDFCISRSAFYQLPEKLGRTKIVNLPVFETREEYFDAVREANIYFAPRSAEGVGMVFLEALARGCAVFAADAPTMNEYISHRETGYLLRRHSFIHRRGAWFFHNRLGRLVGMPSRSPTEFEIHDRQNWEEISALDLQMLGDKAREEHRRGYEKWCESTPEYVRFVSEW